MSSKFKQLVSNKKIKIELTTSFKFHQNGVFEQKNFIFMKIAYNMIITIQALNYL